MLAQIAGSPFPVEVLTEAPADALPPGESDLPVVITTAGALRGEMSLRLARDSTFVLAQLLLSESREAVPDFKPEHRDAAEELLRQVAGQTASALKPRWGEVHLRLEFGSPPSWPAGVSGWIGSASGAPAAFWLEWQLSAALVVALTTPPSPPASPSAELPAAPPPDSPAGPAGNAYGCRPRRDPPLRRKTSFAARDSRIGAGFGGRTRPPGAGTSGLIAGWEIDRPRRGSRRRGKLRPASIGSDLSPVLWVVERITDSARSSLQDHHSLWIEVNGYLRIGAGMKPSRLARASRAQPAAECCFDYSGGSLASGCNIPGSVRRNVSKRQPASASRALGFRRFPCPLQRIAFLLVCFCFPAATSPTPSYAKLWKLKIRKAAGVSGAGWKPWALPPKRK